MRRRPFESPGVLRRRSWDGTVSSMVADSHSCMVTTPSVCLTKDLGIAVLSPAIGESRGELHARKASVRQRCQSGIASAQEDRGCAECDGNPGMAGDFEHPLEKQPSDYFRTNIAITTTGVFSHAALIAAIGDVGVDNVMFSIDYPFESTEQAVQFIRTAPLAPADQARVAHLNAERILRLNQ
jgi:hypothetical protein